jgi:hypothetical protein
MFWRRKQDQLDALRAIDECVVPRWYVEEVAGGDAAFNVRVHHPNN